MRELRERVRPFRVGSFSLNLSGGFAVCGRRDVAAPAAGAKRKDNLRFSFLFELLPFPCFLIWRRLPICDRCEKEYGRGFFSAADELPLESVLLSNLFAVSDTVLLHMWFHLRKRGMTVPRNSLTRYTARHLRIRRLVQFIFVGAVYHNALTNCAALLCRACEDFPVCVAVIYL